MEKKTAKKATPGRTSPFSELYQLHLDVEAIADNCANVSEAAGHR
jgi:hypothetical protein